jgi:membrane-bound serine protease (ClpP class)
MTERRHAIPRAVARTLLAAGIFLVAVATPVHAATPQVTVLTADGVVDNVMASYLADGISTAGQAGAAAVIIELNTPGGSLTSMQDITGAMLESTVPVIVWVTPAGGWAASAGTFIALAGNLTYMAPGTSIGAASPVDSSGGDITGTEGDKIRSIAVSTITSIAEARGRPVDWPVTTVTQAKSASAAEAVSLGVVDGIAASRQAVLDQAQGKQVTTKAGTVTIDVAGAEITEAPMSPVQSFLHLLSDPNIAFVLFVVGIGALLLELLNPTVMGGIVGVLCLILAFIGFGSLPINVAGLLLIAFGMLLLALETQITSHGLLALGGLVSFVLGASILYAPPGGDPVQPVVGVAAPVIAVAAVAMAALMGAIAWAAVRVRRMRAPRGAVGSAVESGTVGVVQAPLTPLGTVHLGGETWSARTLDGTELQRGTPVRLVRMDGLVAVVAPDATAPPIPSAQPPSTPATAVPPPGRP